MQHAIINAMKCMRAIKDRIARPASQLAIISIEPLYHAQRVSRWKSSVRDLQDSSNARQDFLEAGICFKASKSAIFKHKSEPEHSNTYGQNYTQVLNNSTQVLATRQSSIQREMLTPNLKPAGEQRNRLLQKASNTSIFALLLQR
ncbi:hypothetical protein F511_05665 [Dorcoceras hygrometricum]|uniref:Uncharacterized protein n=1 Tax=Dorcoceras hygrometricum TaxID=472368 RepID=A0A2Z7C2V3_9LAMI|nr:hypothetical protein F511_05665 [Dorcoceras hygrometricum]